MCVCVCVCVCVCARTCACVHMYTYVNSEPAIPLPQPPKYLGLQAPNARTSRRPVISETDLTLNSSLILTYSELVSSQIVMEGAKEATQKMNQIANMLNKDVEHMHELNNNIAQVSSVVDNNSATSEETAAVSQEQMAQVETMVSLIEKFEI